MNLKKIIKSAIDLHVHIGPEVIPRKFEIRSLLKKQTNKISGLAVKNHFFSTAPWVAGYSSNSINILPSVTLNNSVGGLNPDIVYQSSYLNKQPLIVWFPTINSELFLKNSKYEIPPEWVNKKGFKPRLSKNIKPVKILNRNGRLNIRAKNTLRAINKTNSILATGHISPTESFKLVKKALEVGIKKIIVTHPIYQKINMPIKMQKKLALMGAYIEQCYSMYSIDKIAIKKIAKQIKIIGSQYCFLSSDVGQPFSPDPDQALLSFSKLLLEQGFNLSDLKTMLVDNPKKIISNTS